MSRITDAFENKKAFVAYLMAGDPDIAATREYILTLANAGADIIEVGMPFSDPLAEGEVIQAANIRSLRTGTTLNDIFAMISSLKDEVSTPLILMGYINPVFRFGYGAFFSECEKCGVSGVILPDLPLEEQGEVMPFADKYGIDLITMIAPTSKARIAKAARNARGFIYLVSSLGVTGERREISTDIASLVKEIRSNTNIPCAVGFGIGSPEQAREMRRYADGVVVGSAIVRIIEKYGKNANEILSEYVKTMIY